MMDLNKCANFEIAKQCFNEELAFRIRCRRNRLLGLWAAAELGLYGPEADEYARSILAFGIDQSGDEAVVHRIIRDTSAMGASCAEHMVRAEMDRLSQIAAMEYAVGEPGSKLQAA